MAALRVSSHFFSKFIRVLQDLYNQAPYHVFSNRKRGQRHTSLNHQCIMFSSSFKVSEFVVAGEKCTPLYRCVCQGLRYMSFNLKNKNTYQKKKNFKNKNKKRSFGTQGREEEIQTSDFCFMRCGTHDPANSTTPWFCSNL